MRQLYRLEQELKDARPCISNDAYSQEVNPSPPCPPKRVGRGFDLISANDSVHLFELLLGSPLSAPPLAALYRRVSTDHQDGSLALQEKRVLEYCTFKSLATFDALTFSDPDTSGRTPMMDRLGGRALLNRLKLGDVNHLVIAKLDRLGRNVRDALSVLEFLQEHKVTLHITDFGGETISTQGHMGRLILTVLLAVAEWEVEEIRDRTTKQMRARFNRGELTGNIPFGFNCIYQFADGTQHTAVQRPLSAAELASREVTSKRLVDDLDEQDTIQLMSQLRRQGLALNKIAQHLNRAGTLTKLGRPWQTGTVDSVLNSRHTAKVLAGLQTSAQEAA